ncbi:hypothetical protein R8Z50_00975 [Longispora sp. K20-0274]|uniref:hypothetical protein n=1 Tax=Longispora sp. K20-0274 TaxID=3088255 RepID=UPI00399AC32E
MADPVGATGVAGTEVDLTGGITGSPEPGDPPPGPEPDLIGGTAAARAAPPGLEEDLMGGTTGPAEAPPDPLSGAPDPLSGVPDPAGSGLPAGGGTIGSIAVSSSDLSGPSEVTE